MREDENGKNGFRGNIALLIYRVHADEKSIENAQRNHVRTIRMIDNPLNVMRVMRAFDYSSHQIYPISPALPREKPHVYFGGGAIVNYN